MSHVTIRTHSFWSPYDSARIEDDEFVGRVLDIELASLVGSIAFH